MASTEEAHKRDAWKRDEVNEPPAPQAIDHELAFQSIHLAMAADVLKHHLHLDRVGRRAVQLLLAYPAIEQIAVDIEDGKCCLAFDVSEEESITKAFGFGVAGEEVQLIAGGKLVDWYALLRGPVSGASATPGGFPEVRREDGGGGCPGRG